MTDNVIKVSVRPNKQNSVKVSSNVVSTTITANSDTSQIWSQVSKNWAVSENIVDNTDYSSKYYANKAKESANNALSISETVKVNYNEFLTASLNANEEIQMGKNEALTSLESAKVEAENSINNTKITSIDDIELIANAEKQEIQNVVDTGKEEVKEAVGDLKVLTTLEIGDIGIAPLGIDETKGKRRYLNGQLIIQEQYVQFTNKVKSAVALYPSLACTESEWQTAVTMSTFGACGKFVIDDTAGTIRLPKITGFIQGLTDLSQLANLVEAGLPTHTHTRGTMNITGTWRSGSSGYGTIQNGGEATGAYYKGASTGSTPSFGNTDGAILGFDASRSWTGSTSTGNYSSPLATTDTVQPEAIKYPYFIQVATGSETEDNITNTIELNNPFSLLDYKFSEYELNNISWLRSQGQYNSKAIYPAVYELLLKIYNGTETKAGVSVKLSTEAFTDYDFVLNTAEETFRLPIKVKQKFYSGGDVPVVGNGMALGITDGTNNLCWASDVSNTRHPACTDLGVNVGSARNTSAGPILSNVALGVTTDPTKSGIVAKLSQSEVSGLYLYFYVGETVQNANLINAGRIEEKLVDMDVELSQKLNKSQITNCLLEVPQRIKYDLTDGTLTIKAGSVVIVPNGVGVYDDLMISIDKTATQTQNETRLYFYNGSYIEKFPISQCYSGSIAPTGSTYMFWYDTTNNLVKKTSDGGTNWETGWSLPFAICTATNGAISSIDQVFNGFGYIGSTVWVDKGVKGLAPNGRNEDGTLRNIEYTTPKFITRTLTHTQANDELALNTSNATIARHPHYELRDDNYLYYTTGQKAEGLVVYGSCDVTSGVVSNFNPKQPFRAVDYNDASGLGMPSNKYIDLTLGASGSTYTAPANGYVWLSKEGSASGQYGYLINNTTVAITTRITGSGQLFSAYIPVKRGDVFSVEYSLAGATRYFRFYYAEGDK